MKIKLTLFTMVLFVMCHFFYSCDDIVSRDLSKKWVYGIAPQDFSLSAEVTQTFKWKEVKGAESYNLQILRTTDTTYSKILEFVADTNVTGTQYTCSLKPGFYKWEIYAQNNGSQSGLSVFRFQIDSTSDLSKQRIVLLSPTDNKSNDTLEQTFTWSPLSAAKSYNFQIYPANNGTIALVSVTVPAGTTSWPYTFPVAGGVYYWQVSATNGVSSTPISKFKLTIDTSGVPAPTLVSPINDSTTVTGNYVALKWNNVKNATSYYVETKNSSAQTDTSATIQNPLVTFCNFYGAKPNIRYYWRVKAMRGAREGIFSNWVLFKRH